jgi:anti-anti-sigma factor
LINETVWIRVEGKGNFQNSTPLKEFAREMLGRGHRDFVVDLKGCPLMDSTFMGTLAGIALKTRAEGSGGLHIVNLNERNLDLLCNLGLDQLMRLDAPPAGPVLNGEAVCLDMPAQADKSVEAPTPKTRPGSKTSSISCGRTSSPASEPAARRRSRAVPGLAGWAETFETLDGRAAAASGRGGTEVPQPHHRAGGGAFLFCGRGLLFTAEPCPDGFDATDPAREAPVF